MPIYEYECNDCGHLFETMRKFRDAPLTECPSCGTDALQKLISKVAFRLKGTGWYETDFKTKPVDDKTTKQGDSDKGDTKEKKDTPAAADKSGSTDSEAKKTTAKAED